MPDLLTHVLVMYIALTLVGFRIDWLTESRIVVGMAGAIIPDIAKISLLVPPQVVAVYLGLPFSWAPLHRLGGSLLTVAVLSLFVDEGDRRIVLGLLAAGVISHLVLDAFLAQPGPETYDILYPLTHWPFPVFNFDLYMSSDPWPSIVTSLTAIAVFVYTKYSDQEPSEKRG